MDKTLVRSKSMSEDILKNLTNEMKSSREVLLCAKDGNIKVSFNLLLITSPLMRNMVRDYPACVTPVLIVPDVKLQVVGRFQNIITYLTTGAFDKPVVINDQEKELEQFCDMFGINGGLFGDQHKEGSKDEDNINNIKSEYSIKQEHKHREFGENSSDSAFPNILKNKDEQEKKEKHHMSSADTEPENYFEKYIKELDVSEFDDPKEKGMQNIKSEPFYRNYEQKVSFSSLSCNVCEKQYDLKTQVKLCYTRHFYKPLKFMFNDLINKETKSCTLCGKNFKTQRRVVMHIGIRHNKIEEVINIQNQKNYVKEDITVTAVKPASKTFRELLKTTETKCEDCNKEFSSITGLSYHKKQHMDNSKFYCYKCDRFIHSNSYEKHMSISNCAKNKDEYKCEVCSKGFAYPSTLEIHKKIHTEEKVYACSLCTKRFRQENNLRIHKKKKHIGMILNN